MKKSNLVWIFAIITIFILLVLNFVFSTKIQETKQKLVDLNSTEVDINFAKKKTLQSKCPDSAGGNKQSYLQIKYFYSEYCPWCKKQEPILQKLISEYGNLIYIEWFNINSCPEDADKYKVSGVPTTVFRTSDEKKEYSHYGFIYEEDLRKLICDVTGGC
jgi:thiol-disulfide isomerase/thioredoxin